MEIPGKFESPTSSGSSTTSGKEPENGHEIEDALANRMYYRTESLSTELISSAENPHELFTGLRSLEKMLEDSNITQGLSERYTPPRMLSLMYERAEVLGLKGEDLEKQGLIKGYDEATGEGTPKKRKFASLALRVDEVPIYLSDKQGNAIVDANGRKREVGVDLVYNFGTPKERAEMAKAYERATLELEARDILGEHISLRLNLDYRDSLEGLTAMLHSGRMPKFKADHLHAIFNMPGLAELEANPENKVLGDQVEEAMFLNLVMLNSGSKQRMQDFLDRPGSRYLMAKIAKENGMEYEEWKLKYIGKVEDWVDDMNRDPKKTWREEKNDGRRGALTEWANIAAWGGGPGEFNAKNETEFIEETIGKLCGSKEASWVAATMMRVIGAYASEGYVALPNGKSHLPLGEGRYISGDDTGKFWAYMFNMKEGTAGRASGLKDLIGKIPDMAMNLFDWAQVEVEGLPPNPDGTPQKRSIWDAWLGTKGGQPKVDLLTGERSDTEITIEEGYHRLGDLNFKSLEREFHGTFSIMQWLMGNERGPTGVLIEALKTDFRFEDDFSLNSLKKLRKYIGIVMNPVVLTKGSTQLYTYLPGSDGRQDMGESAKVIQRNYFRNLMLARIHSAAFALGVLNAKTKMFSPEPSGAVEVPAAVLVKAFVEVAIKDSPKDEDALIMRYIDENKKLRSLGSGNGPGISTDIDAIMNAKFEPEKIDSGGNPKSATQLAKELEQMKHVGRVVGRKIQTRA